MLRSFLLLFAMLAVAGARAAEPQVNKVILMIGDGMGLAQITELILTQDKPLNMERATSGGLQKTFSANNRVTDSAASGTALATGTKTGNGRLGMDMDGNELKSTLAKAAEKGYATGFVVTCFVQHATPGAFYAHVDKRSKYEKIAEQLVETNIDLFIGGGLKYFKDRKDSVNLIPALKKKNFQVVYSLDAVKAISKGKVAGLLSEKHMPSMLDGRGNYLPEATAKALEILSNNSQKGFFLMVEGSQIDFEGHNNNIKGINAETLDFDKAVGVAFDYADKNPGTLVVVTADHETGGLTLPSNKDDFTLSDSGLSTPFSTKSHTATMVPILAYGTGAEQFGGILDNTEIAKRIQKLMGFK